MSTVSERLVRRTLELVDIPSVSREEARIVAYVADSMPRQGFDLLYEEDETLFFALRDPGERPRVLLAGHLDTVPPQENLPGRVEADAVLGLGASDMKGGVAVMIELARWVAENAPSLQLAPAFLFFGREELPAEESPLPRLFERVDAHADLAVMLEPTDNTLQVGCLGNLNATVTFRGESAHSARPWLGVNAIDVAIEDLAPLTRIEPIDVEVSGLVFREVLTVTGIEGGLAANVVPDRASARLNYRYAPTRSPSEAEARLRELVGRRGTLSFDGNSPPGRVSIEAPLVQRLREAGEFAVEPKQAWTPVAEFNRFGLDAVNLGPGATRYAHRRDEQIEIKELVRTWEALRRFLLGSV